MKPLKTKSLTMQLGEKKYSFLGGVNQKERGWTIYRE